LESETERCRVSVEKTMTDGCRQMPRTIRRVRRNGRELGRCKPLVWTQFIRLVAPTQRTGPWLETWFLAEIDIGDRGSARERRGRPDFETHSRRGRVVTGSDDDIQ